MATNKPILYLYSGGNIAGSTLALIGLGLFFGGVIHAFWWAIVAGLYSVGVLAWPRSSSLAQEAERAQLVPEHLAQQVHKLVDSVAKGLPDESVERLRSIESTLRELLPRLQDLSERGVISGKDAFTVVETVRRYLPDTLAAYLRLPKLYAQMQPLADGRTAAHTLLEQLTVLDQSLMAIARSAFAGDAEGLMRNGRFLESRFGEGIGFRS